MLRPTPGDPWNTAIVYICDADNHYVSGVKMTTCNETDFDCSGKCRTHLTVKILRFRTPEKIVVIILKLERYRFTTE